MWRIRRFKDKILKVIFNKYFLLFLSLVSSLFVLFSNMLQARKLYVFGIFVCCFLVILNFLVFEKKESSNEKLALICMFTSIAAISRCALYFLPFIKPLTAVVILSAMFLDLSESFLVGALSMLVSNVFLGQGPWTFWQMVSAGFVGVFASFVFNKLNIKTSKLSVSVVAFVCVFLIYSLIMNVSSYVFMFPDFNINMFLTYLITCLTNDILHLISTIIILIPVCDMSKKYILGD